METSLFDAAVRGFLNILQLKAFFAMMIGVSIGTFTAVAPQGLGMPLVYAILLPIVIKWEPLTGIAILIAQAQSARFVLPTCRYFLAFPAALVPRLPFSMATRWERRVRAGARLAPRSWPAVWEA